MKKWETESEKEKVKRSITLFECEVRGETGTIPIILTDIGIYGIKSGRMKYGLL